MNIEQMNLSAGRQGIKNIEVLIPLIRYSEFLVQYSLFPGFSRTSKPFSCFSDIFATQSKE